MATTTSFEVIPATALDDVELLRPVLESAVVHPLTKAIVTEDIEDILSSVPRSDADMEQKYSVVAWSTEGAKALGMMSLIAPGNVMLGFAETPNPIEITNAYVLRESRGSGVGRSLVKHLEDHAASHGYTELILNSGPRFRRSGWPFWRGMYGDPVGIAKDYYGPRFDAPVWRKSLTDEK